MPHELPALPYGYNELEPYIDEQTLRLHHDKHHLAYVNGFNKAEEMLKHAREQGDFTLIKHWSRELAFHGAGHFLHSIFWESMSPKGGGVPDGALLSAIEKNFSGFEPFVKQFKAAAVAVEGSGWALLVRNNRTGQLEILQVEKHQDLSQWVVSPLLACDVWEHAYYLKYQNNRAAFVDAFFNVINWKDAADKLKESARQP